MMFSPRFFKGSSVSRLLCGIPLRKRAAYSLIFAFVMSTLYLLFITNAVSSTQHQLEQLPDRQAEGQAHAAAISASEMGLAALDGHNPGYEPQKSKAFCVDANEDGTCESWGDYEVHALAEENAAENDGLFYLPIPGTGTAGPSDYCSIFYDDQDKDSPCNWNDLRYGDTITIPLFRDDGSGGILTPADAALGFRSMTLRLRTPCTTEDDYAAYATCDRPLLNLDGSIVGEGDALISWQLFATKTTGESLNLLPDDSTFFKGGGRGKSSVQARDPLYNTEIYELLLNTGLSAQSYDTVTINGLTSNWGKLYTFMTQANLQNVYMQLTLDHKLVDSNSEVIPRLEYQVVYDEDEPLPDLKAVGEGLGYAQPHGTIYTDKAVLLKYLTDMTGGFYSLSN